MGAVDGQGECRRRLVVGQLDDDVGIALAEGLKLAPEALRRVGDRVGPRCAAGLGPDQRLQAVDS
jgi:hypothetical protein